MTFTARSAIWICLALCAKSAAAQPPWIVRGQDGEVRFGSVPPAPPAANPVEDAVVERPPSPGPLAKAVPLDGSEGADEDRLPPSSQSALVITSLPGNGNQLGMFSVDIRSVPRADLPQAATLSMPTGWGITWLDGPKTMDLPPQLYHVALDIGSIARVNDKWTWDLGIVPAWFTDWANLRPEAFRLMGRAVGYYNIDANTQIAAGFVYLNRDDIPALPVVGMIWDDQEAGYHHELVFPRPRFSWRWKETSDSSRWAYFGSELGGGSWAIKRQDRTPDVVTIREFRTVGGLEFRRAKGQRAAVELGVVYGRTVESRTGIGDYSPPATGIVRLWFDY